MVDIHNEGWSPLLESPQGPPGRPQRTYHAQMTERGYVDTPGGFEHLGDGFIPPVAAEVPPQ